MQKFGSQKVLDCESLILVSTAVPKNVDTRPFINKFGKVTEHKFIGYPNKVLLCIFLNLINLDDGLLRKIKGFLSAKLLVFESFYR